MIVAVVSRRVHLVVRLVALARGCELPVVIFVPLWLLEDALHDLDAPDELLHLVADLVADLHVWWKGLDQ